MKHTYLLITSCLADPAAPTERIWSHTRNIFDADRTTSYVLNSKSNKKTTAPIFTIFLDDVELLV